MKIIKVETVLFRVKRNYLIVRIETDDGFVGFGDATLNGREMVVKTLVDQYLSEMLVGQDATKINDIWRMIYIGTYWRGGPVAMTALAGIDMALWDIKGKVAGMPLYDLLGGSSRSAVEVYCHAHGNTLEELVTRIRLKIEEGFRTVRYSFNSEDPRDKVLYRQPHQDVAKGHIEVDNIGLCSDLWDSRVYMEDLVKITASLRKEFGPSLGLIHDVHGRFTVSQARQAVKRLDDYGLLFIEDPIDSQNPDGIAQLMQSGSIPVGIGELYNTIDECRDLLSTQRIGYLRIDISHFGGITPSLRAAYLAEAFGVKIAFHGPSDISPLAHAACYHIDTAVPNFGIQEYVEFEPEVRAVFNVPYKYADGLVSIEALPGIGVVVDEEALKCCAPYEKEYLPMLRDRMLAVHNW